MVKIVTMRTQQPVLVLCVLCVGMTAWAESPADGYGDHPTTAVIYDDSDYVDADNNPVYVSGDVINTNKFKLIKTLRQEEELLIEFLCIFSNEISEISKKIFVVMQAGGPKIILGNRSKHVPLEVFSFFI